MWAQDQDPRRLSPAGGLASCPNQINSGQSQCRGQDIYLAQDSRQATELGIGTTGVKTKKRIRAQPGEQESRVGGNLSV